MYTVHIRDLQYKKNIFLSSPLSQGILYIILTNLLINGFLYPTTDIIIATLDAYQNSTLETRQGNDEDKSFNVGAVTLKLTIHNFPHQDLSGVLYDWNLGDGTQLLDSNLKQVTHNFTTVKSCKVVVNLHGQIQGKYYSGTASKTLKFTGMLASCLAYVLFSLGLE